MKSLEQFKGSEKFKSLKNKWVLLGGAFLIAGAVIFAIFKTFAAMELPSYTLNLVPNVTVSETLGGVGVKLTNTSCVSESYVSPCSQTYKYSTSTISTISAYTNSEYNFKGWDTNADGVVNYANNPLNVSHKQSWNITGIFTKKPAPVNSYTLRVSPISDIKSGSGSVKLSDTGCISEILSRPCSVSFPYSATVVSSVTATPYEYNFFKGWDIDGDGTIDYTTNPLKISHKQSRTVRAYFSDGIGINFARPLAGIVSGDGVYCASEDYNDCSQKYVIGTAATTYSINSLEGVCVFKGWDTNNDGVVNYTTTSLAVSHKQDWYIVPIMSCPE